MKNVVWIEWDEEPVLSSDEDEDEYVCSDEDDDEITSREEEKAISIEKRNPITPLTSRKIRKIFDGVIHDDFENQFNNHRNVFTPAKNGKIYINAPYTPAPLKKKQMHLLSQLPWFKNNPNYRPIASEKLSAAYNMPVSPHNLFEDYDPIVETPLKSNNRRKSVSFQDQCEIIHTPEVFDQHNNQHDDGDYPDDIKNLSMRLFQDDNEDDNIDTSVLDNNIHCSNKKVASTTTKTRKKRTVRTRRRTKSKVVKLKEKIKGVELIEKPESIDCEFGINKFIKKRAGKSAFQFFVSDKMQNIRTQNTGTTYSQMIYHLTILWNQLSIEEKNVCIFTLKRDLLIFIIQLYFNRERYQRNSIEVNTCTNVY